MAPEPSQDMKAARSSLQLLKSKMSVSKLPSIKDAAGVSLQVQPMHKSESEGTLPLINLTRLPLAFINT